MLKALRELKLTDDRNEKRPAPPATGCSVARSSGRPGKASNPKKRVPRLLFRVGLIKACSCIYSPTANKSTACWPRWKMAVLVH
jgi:hypothetical protein